MRFSMIGNAVAVCALAVGAVQAEDMYGLKPGQPELKSMTALTFGPDGILFIGDAQAAKVVAIDTNDDKSSAAPAAITGIEQKIAKKLGLSSPAALKVTELAVNPETGHAFIAVAVENQSPRLLKINGDDVAEIDLKNVPFAQVALPNAAEDKEVGEGRRRRNNRASAITDLAFIEGRVIVSGLSSDNSASNVWSVQFPFDAVDTGTTVEFYHGAHGRSEDYAPIRTFIPFIIDGEPNLLAGFVCTPLVRFPLEKVSSASKQHEKVTGTTVAELGNRNQPLDMIAYKQNGKDYLLLSNSARGVMKVSTDGIADNPGISAHVPDGGTAGQAFETIAALNGTVQMDKLSGTQAILLLQQPNGSLDLQIIALP
ncbi:hypothetical protein [Planctomicrobium piriforme]|uniref:Uncharacterized protein n=1 Tax=Planctomicrobium piriforme TaxID=1576369 RepID=A0A1I3MMV8_9PLAN|nr:hypothetical protein [Planctomicrobium piriforme]SFI98261.1 hypothetical protein SAMN05421753_11453 [Planctomicrobium piriforme]